MGEVIFSFKVEIGYEPGRGVEVRLKHKGLVSRRSGGTDPAGKEVIHGFNFTGRAGGKEPDRNG
jgi:hypothetical protein